jgi:hypothetical protein
MVQAPLFVQSKLAIREDRRRKNKIVKYGTALIVLVSDSKDVGVDSS